MSKMIFILALTKTIDGLYLDLIKFSFVLVQTGTLYYIIIIIIKIYLNKYILYHILLK
jgi:hypothetical protein